MLRWKDEKMKLAMIMIGLCAPMGLAGIAVSSGAPISGEMDGGTKNATDDEKGDAGEKKADYDVGPKTKEDGGPSPSGDGGSQK